MNEIIINSWEEFVEQSFVDCFDATIQRSRSNYIFRGLSDAGYPLVPSLNRVCRGNLHLEKSLLRNFRKYASEQISSHDNMWDILSIAQHHGMPTRLLDWTFSPFVAAHFATESFEKYDSDGVIWCLDFVKCNANIPKQFVDELEKENAYTFSTEMLGNVVKSLEDFYMMGKDIEAFPVFFEPPAIDQRIVNQYALFSVMSDPTVLISDWMSIHPSYWHRLIIPAKTKLEIRDKLDQINITERIIYPGLDGLCKWLSRHYRDTDSIYNP